MYGPGMRMELRLDMLPRQRGGKERYISPILKTRIAGEELEYRLVSQTFLDEIGAGSTMGTVEDDVIYVNKNLHPAQMPFAALILHYQKLEPTELEDRLGIKGLERLDSDNIHAVALDAALVAAVEKLRPKEMKDLAERIRHEPYFSASEHESVLEDLRIGYPEDAGQITEYEGEKTDFYFERVREAAIGHHKNRWVKSIKGLADTASSFDDERLALGMNIRVDKAIRYICDDMQLQDLPPLLDFVNSLLEHEPGERVELDPMQSRMIYLCTEAYDSHSRSEPLTFIDGDKGSKDRTPTNYVRLNAGAHRYLHAIKSRLEFLAVEELEEIKLTLEGIDKYVREVHGIDPKKMQAAAQTTVRRLLGRTDEAGKDAQVLEQRAYLEAAKESRVVTVSETEVDIRRLLTAGKAYSALKELGLENTEVTRIIKNEGSEQERRLKDALTGRKKKSEDPEIFSVRF